MYMTAILAGYRSHTQQDTLIYMTTYLVSGGQILPGHSTNGPSGAGAQGELRLSEPCPDVIGAGQDQGAGLAGGLDPLGAGGALGDHQRPDRLHLPVPALRRASRTPGLGSPGG